MPRYAIAGAGFAGAVLARELVELSDCHVFLFDERDHIGGNCYTERDPTTGVLVHKYGPHIFNTNDAEVWSYVRRFGEFVPFVNRVKANTCRGIFSLPINLHTINQFFGTKLTPVAARDFLKSRCVRLSNPSENFESFALSSIGEELYRTFVYGYTKKQWGCEPRDLPASILKRLPIRFTYDDSFYDTRFQGMPIQGYTPIIANILNHPRISVSLRSSYTPESNKDFDHVFYTGSPDRYFNYTLGRLPYRSLKWDCIVDASGEYQGVAVMNYPDEAIPHTRISEHKHFAPWEQPEKTLAFVEHSFEAGLNDIPYYPKRLKSSDELYSRYLGCAQNEWKVSFLGRLGSYRYLNMDGVIAASMRMAKRFLIERNS